MLRWTDGSQHFFERVYDYVTVTDLKLNSLAETDVEVALLEGVGIPPAGKDEDEGPAMTLDTSALTAF